ncbi:D-alanyl-D-alanine carboxypeptidase, partial [Streptomyces sp. SID8014]|nr:D-alanyl-D-alanine carboxypeptidase [Streptomyces sp. SID8014]
MAGEIPDRSEQKKASGEPEVPAAETPDPATDDRDPRIAVARETPDRTDQATTVLRADGERGGESDGGKAGDTAADAEGGKAGDEEPAEGEARTEGAAGADDA